LRRQIGRELAVGGEKMGLGVLVPEAYENKEEESPRWNAKELSLGGEP